MSSPQRLFQELILFPRQQTPSGLKFTEVTLFSQSKVKINGVDVPQVVFKNGSQLVAREELHLKICVQKALKSKLQLKMNLAMSQMNASSQGRF